MWNAIYRKGTVRTVRTAQVGVPTFWHVSWQISCFALKENDCQLILREGHSCCCMLYVFGEYWLDWAAQVEEHLAFEAWLDLTINYSLSWWALAKAVAVLGMCRRAGACRVRSKKGGTYKVKQQQSRVILLVVLDLGLYWIWPLVSLCFNSLIHNPEIMIYQPLILLKGSSDSKWENLSSPVTLVCGLYQSDSPQATSHLRDNVPFLIFLSSFWPSHSQALALLVKTGYIRSLKLGGRLFEVKGSGISSYRSASVSRRVS